MATRSLAAKAADNLGLTTLSKCSKDIYILLTTRFIRMIAYGSSTLILALYFSALNFTDTQIGLFMSLTLVGDVAISLVLTLVADRLGRRRILIGGALLMALSGIIFAISGNFWFLLAAAVVGVISPSGNEIGPFRAVEESTIAHLTEAETRSDVFAWYVIAGTLGTAGGSLSCGWAVQRLQDSGWSAIQSFRVIFWFYTLAGLVKAASSLLLSPACEAPPKPQPVQQDDSAGEELQPFLDSADAEDTTPKPAPKKPGLFGLSAKSQATLTKLCMLFFFDSLASGMVPGSLVAFFVNRKFGMPEGQLGTIMSSASFASSIGNVFASAIAKRIGLVKTMVFTHFPSAVLLALFPFPSSLTVTAVLLVARSLLSSMDQAPRSAFLSAVVLPEERTAVMGIVNTVKTMSQSSGPLITGVLAGKNHFWVAFVIAGVLKGSYDMGLLAMFVNTRIEGDAKAKAPPGETSAVSEDAGDQSEDEQLDGRSRK
ncbi:hypothetical protein LTR62_001012 [Meristemomyces frigidus]|uniref:Major facilitator superfamily (MFS) profile domain-containing protein n=1 Tax=Meristemomyces frigidus TaxID=1508187 RepID=A0AAN7TC71_9PEZI|nr:hypothetical protein LTR62_001012 [Meristemomyces frigidus]